MTGAGESDRPTFDPRHDPRFQRGYQPGDGRSAPAGRAAAPAATPAVADPTVRDDPAGIEELDLTALDADTFPDELEVSRWNPFIAVLWLLGVVLPVGGLVVQWQAVRGMFGNNSYSGNGEPPMSMILQQFSYLAAPPMITAGILIIAGLLFWHAVVWRARRGGLTPRD